MMRISWALAAALLLVIAARPGAAADAELVGNWKLVLLTPDRPVFWLLAVESKDGKLSASVLDARKGVPTPTIKDVAVTDGRVTLTFDVGPQSLKFDGVLSKEAGKPIRGSLELDRLVLAQLEPTTAKNISGFETNKEIVAGPADDQRFFDAALGLLTQAAENKAKPEDVRAWADKANKAAETFGPRFHRDVVLQIADTLVKQDGYADIALPYARRAEKMLDAKAGGAEQVRVLNVLAAALRKTNKTDELKEVEARIDKIDVSIPFTKFGGRKDKSDRVVLVELFTGAECPPCVAADFAFDALVKSYEPSEVVFLQYHLHIPGPDPLTNEDTETRSTFYGDAVEGTPTLIANGRPLNIEGGSSDEAPRLYQALRNYLDKRLEDTSKAKLKVAATRKGDKIDISADVADLEDAAPQIKLRLALVEEEVQYTGGNQVRKHHRVVRVFPGGVNGVAVKTKTFSHSASVNLEELRKNLTAYLDEYAKNNKETPFPNKQRPMELKNLKVVAFLQNDKTKEILQAAQGDVKGE